MLHIIQVYILSLQKQLLKNIAPAPDFQEAT